LYINLWEASRILAQQNGIKVRGYLILVNIVWYMQSDI
jgi:hypothetical protein